MSNEFPIKADARTEWWMTEMIIDDSVSTLTRILSAIEKWEDIAWAEFEEWKKDIEKRHPDGFEHGYDPINDEGVMSVYTECALYGSLAVNIAAVVEDRLASLFQGVTILKDGSNGKEAKKNRHFGDYMCTLEKVCGCQREDVKHYGDHMFVRELANRFKHSGGNATKEFIEKYGTIASVDRDGEQIPYNRYCWECYIQQAKELLIDVAKRLTDNDGRKSE